MGIRRRFNLITARVWPGTEVLNAEDLALDVFSDLVSAKDASWVDEGTARAGAWVPGPREENAGIKIV